MLWELVWFLIGILIGVMIAGHAFHKYFTSRRWAEREKVILAQYHTMVQKARKEAAGYDYEINDLYSRSANDS